MTETHFTEFLQLVVSVGVSAVLLFVRNTLGSIQRSLDKLEQRIEEVERRNGDLTQRLFESIVRLERRLAFLEGLEGRDEPRVV